jgi:dipeptidyl-peptidase-4
MMSLLALGLAAALSAPPASPPHTADLDREIARIFDSRELTAKTLGDVRWIDGGRAYTKLEPASGADPRTGPKDVVEYDTASGRRSVLVPAAKITAPGAKDPIAITDYQWSEGRSKLLIFTNAKKVWRQNTRGDYWVYELASGSLKKVGGDAPASSMLFARFSPDGTRVAWVRANDLWVQDLASGAITRLTSTGSETIINGTSDWVTEEELRLREAYKWSSDGRSIAYWSFDTSGVGVYTLIDDTDSLYPEVKRYPYPKVGTKNSAVHVGVVPAAGGATKWIDLPGDPREHYVARMEWSNVKEAPGALVLERLNRLQNVVELFLADGATGQARSIYRDESKTWVDVTTEIRSVDGGRAFLMESDRDGWRHVWRASRDGGAPILVTRFEGDVEGVTAVDEKGGWLYFLASPDRPTERHLYRCRLDGGAKSGAT